MASSRWVSAAIAVLCAVQFVDVLGVTSATTAIPAIVSDLDAAGWTTGLVATAYAACFGGFLILGARLGDRYGARRVLLTGLIVYAVVGALGAAALDVWPVVAARGGQGLAAAISVPAALQLLLDATPEPGRRRTAVAAWGATGAAAGALGFLAGGVLTSWWSWRAIFLVNVPVGVLLVILVGALVSPRPALPRQRVDGLGAAVLVVAIMAVVVGASLLEQEDLRLSGLGALGAGAALTTLFVLRQRSAAEPLIPPAALRHPDLRTGTLLSFVNTATTSSTGVLITLHLQQQQGASAWETGLLLMPFSLAVVVGSMVSKPLSRLLADRPLAVGGLLGVALGNGILALTAGSRPGVIIGVIAAGLGLGLASVAATTIGTSVPSSLAGSATGLLNTGAQLGTALGVAGFVALAAGVGRSTGGGSGSTAGAVVGWVAVGALAAAAAVVLLVRRPRPAPAPEESELGGAQRPGPDQPTHAEGPAPRARA